MVCQAEGCHEAASIYHKSYFKENHFSQVNNKKVIHASAPFDESLHYLNFSFINQLYAVLVKKVTQMLKGLPTDVDAVAQTALYKSPKFK